MRITQFQERTGDEFRQALQELRAASGGRLKGLVLDLRYNPGGLLESSVEVVNNFIGDSAAKTLIVSIRGRHRTPRIISMPRWDQRRRIIPWSC